LAACLGPNLPIVYLEGYSKAREHVLEGRRRMPRVLVSSYGWTTNEALKFLAAEAAECGSRILGHQHGGGYGLWKTHVEDGDADRSDAWFVWGWAGAASNPRTANLPTPKTSELRARDSASTARAHRIVLVGTEHPVYPYYLASIPLGSQYESYIGDRAEFVRGLNSTVRKHLLVRLYPTDYGWGQAGRLREAVGSVELDNHRVRMSRHLRTARVVVVDHPITTLVEALACNCPTILFWNPKLWEARESAVPYLDRLRREGILFDTPSLAAAKLNRVWDDASRWWWSAPVQSARRMFVDQFGGRHANWVEVWRRRLREELDAEE
jgi:putative transferase (TIGR04331 family)